MNDDPKDLWEFPTRIPRHAFNARGEARAADVWRAFQEVTIEASARAGWPPQRYRSLGTAFVMRSMSVRHARVIRYGEQLTARTWVRAMRRGGMLCTRQVELHGSEGLVCEGTQEWVHVSAELKPTRADETLLRDFVVREEGSDIVLPTHENASGALFAFELDVWHGWMDPLDHVNHPAYLDWTDETLFRRMFEHGLSPQQLVPAFERIVYLRGVSAPNHARVTTQLLGPTASGAKFTHEIEAAGTVCARVQSIRTIPNTQMQTVLQLFS